jgi:glycosyltransferase involved in cell wall biosynthesis
MAATYPPRRGNQIRTWGLLSNLSSRWRVDSYSLTIQRTDLPLPRRVHPVTSNWNDHRTLSPLLTAWMAGLGRLGYPQAYTDQLLGLTPRRRLTSALAEADVVMVAPPYHLAWVRRHTPVTVPVVLDEHSIEAHMYRKQDNWLGRRIAAEVDHCERRALGLADMVLVTCEPDAEYAVAAGARRVEIVPNAADLNRFRPVSSAERTRIRNELGLPPDRRLGIFIGSGHPPNVAAVVRLEEQAWRYAESGLLVLVVGRSGLGRPRVEGVLHVGEVTDVVPYLQAADLALCPLESGSGTSIKMAEYLAAGLPLVSTEVGVRGLQLKPGVEVVVCALDEMPEQAATLLASSARMAAMCAAARQVAEERFGWDSAARRLSDALESLAC